MPTPLPKPKPRTVKLVLRREMARLLVRLQHLLNAGDDWVLLNVRTGQVRRLGPVEGRAEAEGEMK